MTIKPACGLGSVNGCDPTCDCGLDLCNLPNPYVAEAEASQENHTSTVIQQLYVTGLSIKTNVIVPACGQTTVVAINGLHSILLGAYLWNPTYGHFKVVAFDYETSQVTLENECQTGNVDPGETVPAGTLFLAVDAPCCDDAVGGSLYYPYLETDFVVPAVGNCLDIKVTSIVGLSTGMEVQIGTGVYRVSSLVATDIINICNDGNGATSGTVVTAKDSADAYIAPITAVGVALCGGSSATQGSLVICADGNPTTLAGSSLGYVPVVVDSLSDKVEFKDPATLWSINPCTWDVSSRISQAPVDEYGASNAFSLASVDQSVQATTNDILLTNNTCSDALVMFSLSGFTSGGNFNASSGGYANMHLTLDYASVIGDIGETTSPTLANLKAKNEEVSFNRSGGDIKHDFRLSETETLTIPAGKEARIKLRFGVAYSAGDISDYSGNYAYTKVVGRVLAI